MALHTRDRRPTDSGPVVKDVQCSGPSQVQGTTTWERGRVVCWALATLIGVVTFIVPIHSLEATTSLDVRNDTLPPPRPTEFVSEAVASLFVRIISVFTLLVTASIPCGDQVSRCLSCFSMLIATILFITIVADDDGVLLEAWFSVLFLLFGLIIPFVSLLVETVQKADSPSR